MKQLSDRSSTGKALTTRDGEPVEIYRIHDKGIYCVHGAVYEEGARCWESETWTLSGEYNWPRTRDLHDSDLILANNPDAPREEVEAAIREAVASNDQIARMLLALRALQDAAAIGLASTTEDSPTWNMFAAIHRTAARGMLASDDVTNEESLSPVSATGEMQ